MSSFDEVTLQIDILNEKIKQTLFSIDKFNEDIIEYKKMIKNLNITQRELCDHEFLSPTFKQRVSPSKEVNARTCKTCGFTLYEEYGYKTPRLTPKGYFD